MFKTYILEGHEAVLEPDMMKWSLAFSTRNRVVKKEDGDAVQVSTVFIGLDHQFDEDGPPLIFETMVFGGPLNESQRRYSTWEEAEAGHREMVEEVRKYHRAYLVDKYQAIV